MPHATAVSPLLTAGEAAAYLRASKAKIYRLVKSGDLTGYKVGATLVFFQSELNEFVRRQALRPIASDRRYNEQSSAK